MKTKKQIMGKRSRASGARFELKVRENLEKDWIVLKNPNNVIDDKFKQGKSKYNPFTKRLIMNSAGFPDFIAFTKIWEENDLYLGETLCHCGSQVHQTIIGVESKTNGYLDKTEKEKCVWLLKNKIFAKILIASKSKQGRKVVVEYKEFT